MNLFDITFNSLGRQKGKKFFLLTAMVLSITTVLTLYTFISSQTLTIENQYDEFGANIIVTPKTDTLSMTYGGVSFNEVVSVNEINREDLEKIKEIDDFKSISTISPKLVGAVNIEFRDLSSSGLIVGTDFDSVFKIKGWWEDSATLPEGDNDLIIGYDVAHNLGLTLGDKVVINNREFNVFKVLQPAGNQDDGVIIGKLNVVEKLLNREGKISLVEISALCSECPIDVLVGQIKDVLPNANVRALREVMVKRMEIVDQMEKFALSISIILVLLCSALIFSNIASSVNERKNEIGIYRAIGFTKGNIIQIIQLESFIISFIAGLTGIILTILVSYFILPELTGITRESVVFTKLFYFRGLAGIILIGFISSLTPSIRASNSDPVKAINSL